MTQQEKLQALFDAALKDSSELSKPPTRAFPTPSFLAAAPVAPVAVAPVAAPEPVAVAPVAAPAADLVKPLPNAGLDEKSSNELGALRDDQRQRLSRQRRRAALTSLAVLLALVGGGTGWFVQSPQRMQAFSEAIRDVRSLGDVAALVKSYDAALEKVAARGEQIDEATASMGVTASAADEVDPYFDAEMKEMMGGEGKTLGERNNALQQNFGEKGKGLAGKLAAP